MILPTFLFLLPIDYFSVNPGGEVIAKLADLAGVVADFELVVIVEDKGKPPLSNSSIVIVHVNLLVTTPAPPITSAPIITDTCNNQVSIQEVFMLSMTNNVKLKVD